MLAAGLADAALPLVMAPLAHRDPVRASARREPPSRSCAVVTGRSWGLRVGAGAALALALTGCASSTDSLGADHPNNLLEEVLDVTPEQAEARLADAYEQLFHSEDTETESILVEDEGGGAYVVSVADGAIKTDGLGYALFLAVMLDHQEDFDALWTYARDNLRYSSGARSGLLFWHCGINECPDPNGMTYAATALIFADHRWGEGAHDYAADSRALRQAMLHKEDSGVVEDVRNCFDAETNLVKNSPIGEIVFTTPAFMLPAFYEIWADEGPDADAEQLRDAASAAREALVTLAHDTTGLSWNHVFLDLTLDGGTDLPFADRFAPDSYRVGFNLALDIDWFGGTPATQEVVDDLVAFFGETADDLPFEEYQRDGTPITTSRSVALVAANAAAASVATASPERDALIAALWDLPIPTGNTRYYDGLLYLLALGSLSGSFVPY